MLHTKLSYNELSEIYKTGKGGRGQQAHLAYQLREAQVEIERQRVLILRATEHIKEHEQCYATPLLISRFKFN